MASALGLCQDDSIKIIYPRLRPMRAPWVRAVGLIGRKRIQPGSAFMFRRCPSVHTCFMSVPIDVIICDKYLRVLHVETMQPWRTRSPKIKGAHTVIEATAGSAARLGITSGCLLSVTGKETQCD